MRRVMKYFIVALLFAITYGCVTVADKSFYDVKISLIEINTMEYDKVKYKDELEKFEQEIIKILQKKGYQAFVGPRIINDSWYGGMAAKKLITNSKADAFMIIHAPKILKVKTYLPNAETTEELWQLNVIYALYDRSGEKILISPDRFLWKDTSPIQRKSAMVEFKDEKSFLAGSGKYRFLETEDQFRTRIAEEFTANIPNRQ